MTTAPPSNRWWAPTAPRIGPDPVDLELLAATGDNPRLDLGASVLAAHRVGAAACEVAASLPLVDTGTLINCLADARAELANPMIDSISKSVEGGGYAAVLVRDVLDDAEEAAVDLFQMAVSRGVAPPVAAQRVAMVYGVSKSEVGRYRQLASDPKANPVTVADLADRTLFGFVEKLAAEEAAGAKEPVSKITPEERRRRVTTEQRDASGRWTNVDAIRAAGVQQPEVETEPETEEEGAGKPPPGFFARLTSRGLAAGAAPRNVGITPAEATRQRTRTPTGRAQAPAGRKQTRQAPKPQLTPTGRTVEQRQPTQRTGTQRTGRQRKRIQVSRREQQRTLQATVPEEMINPRPNKQLITSWLSTFDSGYMDDRDHEIGRPVGIATDAVTAGKINRTVAAMPHRIIRAGWLLKELGGNKLEETDSDAYDAAVRRTRVQGVQPRAAFIADDSMPENDADKLRELDRRKRIAAVKWYGNDDLMPLDVRAADDSGVVLLDETVGNNLPSAFEFIIDNAKGHAEGEAGHVQWVLDPNKLYRVNGASRAQGGWEQVWDTKHGLMRTRIHLVEVTEEQLNRALRGEEWEGGKAESPEQRRTAVEHEQRNELGRWFAQQLARPAVEAPAVQRVARRQTLQLRRQRAQTPTAQPQQQQTQRQGSQRQGVQRRAGQRQQAQRQLTPRGQRRVSRAMQSIADAFATRNERQHRKELSFDPFGEYTVLGAAEWNRLVAAGGLGQETGPTARSSTEDRPPAPGLVPTGEHRSRPRALHSAYSDVERLDVFTEEGHAVMIEPGRVMGQDGPDRVVSAYEREGIRGRGDVIEPLAMRHFGDVERGTDEEGRDANDTLIHDLLDRPGVAMVSAVPRDDNASILDVQTNARPPQPIYVIEMDPDMYDADYYTLELTGSAMVSHEALFDDGSQTAYSIPVLHYRQVSVLDDEDYDDD